MRSARKPIVRAITALPAVGHISVAAMYITMGLLTGLVCLGLRHRSPDVRTAIYAIKEQPFGPLLLITLIVCSCALAIWRGLQAFADLEEKGRSFAGLMLRGRLAVSSAIYIGLSTLIVRILLNQPTPSGEQIAQASAAQVAIHPLGWVPLVAVGLICIGVAVFFFYRALMGNFHQWFRCDEMSRSQQEGCFLLGRLGYASRGIILATIGYFVVVGGYNVRPDQITGQAGAVDAIVRQPLGRGVAAVIALGLIGNGLFALATARFGKIPERKIQEVVDKGAGDAADAVAKLTTVESGR